MFSSGLSPRPTENKNRCCQLLRISTANQNFHRYTAREFNQQFHGQHLKTEATAANGQPLKKYYATNVIGQHLKNDQSLSLHNSKIMAIFIWKSKMNVSLFS